jgi:hypothetical protein
MVTEPEIQHRELARAALTLDSASVTLDGHDMKSASPYRHDDPLAA